MPYVHPHTSGHHGECAHMVVRMRREHLQCAFGWCWLGSGSRAVCFEHRVTHGSLVWAVGGASLHLLANILCCVSPCAHARRAARKCRQMLDTTVSEAARGLHDALPVAAPARTHAACGDSLSFSVPIPIPIPIPSLSHPHPIHTPSHPPPTTRQARTPSQYARTLSQQHAHLPRQRCR